ncbi:hypothetical protein [Nitrosomonas sp.]|nr:hypothetical protein [Nitrosomonas sp.]
MNKPITGKSEGETMSAELAEYFLILLGVFMILSVIIGQNLS